MPQVIYSRKARADLVKIREFLKAVDKEAAEKAIQAIFQSLKILERHPESGRPAENMSHEYREWLIRFGNSGYIALYRLDIVREEALVLSIRHQKEGGKSL